MTRWFLFQPCVQMLTSSILLVKPASVRVSHWQRRWQEQLAEWNWGPRVKNASDQNTVSLLDLRAERSASYSYLSSSCTPQTDWINSRALLAVQKALCVKVVKVIFHNPMTCHVVDNKYLSISPPFFLLQMITKTKQVFLYFFITSKVQKWLKRYLFSGRVWINHD